MSEKSQSSEKSSFWKIARPALFAGALFGLANWLVSPVLKVATLAMSARAGASAVMKAVIPEKKG